MLYKQALVVLGIKENLDERDVKKRYRYLMHKVHPDTFAVNKASYKYSAQEINEAYSVVIEHIKNREDADNARFNYEKNPDMGSFSEEDYENYEKGYSWDAQENENAYMKRNIYHYAEGYDGNIIGSFKIASGRYIWKTEEDFPLFIKSIFECSEAILNESDRKSQREKSRAERTIIQAQLAYLLAQQFINATDTLKKLIPPFEADNSDIFYIASMLELPENAPFVRAGMTLYPKELRNHRLYLSNKAGNEVGYISFKDDRMYYIIIPMLEQKRALVKIEISRKQDRLNTKTGSKYKNVDFWVKVPHKNDGTFPENINMQIAALIKKYEKM